jgi:hypothetical protein
MTLTDGSYMKDLFPHIHSAAVVFDARSEGVGHLKWHAAIAVNLLG